MNSGSQQEWTIGRLLRTASGYWQPCALHAAVALDLFTAVGEHRFAAADIIEKLRTDAHGGEALLNALVAMGLLLKSEDRFANSPFARTYLCKDSPQYKGYIVMHHRHLVDGWAQLDQAVRHGGPVKKRSYGEAQERESFQMGMFNLAMDIAPQAAAQIDLRGRRHLLDLGGGPGTYAVHFCLANPELRATVFDRPTTRDFALRTARHFGVGDRVGFEAGDFNTDEIKGRYDVAWLSQILHSNSPEQCAQLVAKTAATLDPGGLLLVHEFFLNDTKDGPLYPALFSLNMLVNNGRGRAYSEKEVRAMLEKAGIREIFRLPFTGPNDSYVIGGRLP